jgi:hypothetical protein
LYFETPLDFDRLASSMELVMTSLRLTPPGLEVALPRLDLAPPPSIDGAVAATAPTIPTAPVSSLIPELAPTGTKKDYSSIASAPPKDEKKDQKAKLLWDDLPVTASVVPTKGPPPALVLPASVAERAEPIELPPVIATPAQATADAPALPEPVPSSVPLIRALDRGRIAVGQYIEIDAAGQANWLLGLTVQEVTPEFICVRGQHGWLAFAVYDVATKQYRGYFEWQEFGGRRSPGGKWGDLYQIRLFSQNGVLRLEGRSPGNEILIRATKQSTAPPPATLEVTPVEAILPPPPPGK